MLIVLSPAKSLDFTPAAPDVPLTTPQLKNDIAELAKVTVKLKRSDLKRLMDISDTLADLNYQRFQAFDPACDDGVQAAIAFDGDVYDGLDARSLDKHGLAFAQDRVRILSGLYGVLRPLDAIQPYRLEMGVRLKTKRGKSLYDFWRRQVAPTLNQALAELHAPTLVNLASQEYFGAVDAAQVAAPVVSCHFYEVKPGEAPKVISFYAKKARGMMARYAIDHRIDRAEGLKGFDVAGYAYQPGQSSESDWIFCRKHPLS
ncbi:peroxide stress protein YaaA [Phenylobacterium montanum]|uniref:UPF0246 protein KCG34_19995 n=1 Tax=Phenylobacterium montanum TaxID=2823693 RepID=A0A975FYH4_9CAUL|nr:peroxide stress protein YaaA [Caulobacter sp. S6]QUD87309.1 peroxide stress protein YaaA [Caulobacter sp. S6]